MSFLRDFTLLLPESLSHTQDKHRINWFKIMNLSYSRGVCSQTKNILRFENIFYEKYICCFYSTFHSQHLTLAPCCYSAPSFFISTFTHPCCYSAHFIFHCHSSFTLSFGCYSAHFIFISSHLMFSSHFTSHPHVHFHISLKLLICI